MRNIPSALARIRHQRLLSQTDLAIEVGINQTRLSQIERGRRSATPDEAQRIADVLRVPVTTIFESPKKDRR